MRKNRGVTIPPDSNKMGDILFVVSNIKWPDYPPPSVEEIQSMADSIKDIGLLHPITVKEDGTGVAGQKRALAYQLLGLETIPCKIIPNDTTSEECEVIRLHENLKRFNLPWYDQVMMEKRLHDLRQEEHGAGKRGKKVGWSLRDTAQELNMSLGGLSEDIRLAEALLADPALRKVGDKMTARRIIFEAVRRAQQEMEAGTLVNFDVNVVHLGSSEVVLRSYPDDSFDVCVTDPPWIRYRDESLRKDEFTEEVFTQVCRVLKQGAFLYAFVHFEDFIIYREKFRKLGLKVQDHLLVWIKEGVLSHGTKTWEYQRDYEFFMLAVKGSPALTSPMLSSIFSFPVVPPAKMIHPNEKPLGLILKILDHCSYEGSLVLDPFAGSGVVGEACKKLGRKYVLIERDKQTYVNILERLK